jgi:uncharacterized Zn finger protein
VEKEGMRRVLRKQQKKTTVQGKFCRNFHKKTLIFYDYITERIIIVAVEGYEKSIKKARKKTITQIWCRANRARVSTQKNIDIMIILWRMYSW